MLHVALVFVAERYRFSEGTSRTFAHATWERNCSATHGARPLRARPVPLEEEIAAKIVMKHLALSVRGAGEDGRSCTADGEA